MFNLAERMKAYEDVSRFVLTENVPVILRLDGRAFHTFCRRFTKPFDDKFIDMMNTVALAVCKEIMNARIAYVQSDEISVLIQKRNTMSDSWFENTVQKMVSISAGTASAVATQWIAKNGYEGLPTFDSRVFVMPTHEVINYFIWRQNDWQRNSMQMLARSFYSQKELNGKSVEEMGRMVVAKGKNWFDLSHFLCYGRCAVRKVVDVTPNPAPEHSFIHKTVWEIDNDIPLFVNDREYILKNLEWTDLPNKER